MGADTPVLDAIAGMTAASVWPGNPVIEGLSTAEVRWMLPGPLNAAAAGWFGRFPAETESRKDAYLVDPELRGLSVKVRAGRAVDVKVYYGDAGLLEVPVRARGRIQAWRKWSFPTGPLGPGGTGPPAWTVVRKSRRISRFRLAGGRLIAGVPGRAMEPACAVELTEVRSGGETWWSLGFEATGPADSFRSMLQSTAALVFAQAPPGDVDLGMSSCQSYAEWLARRRAPGATETTGQG